MVYFDLLMIVLYTCDAGHSAVAFVCSCDAARGTAAQVSAAQVGHCMFALQGMAEAFMSYKTTSF